MTFSSLTVLLDLNGFHALRDPPRVNMGKTLSFMEFTESAS